MPEYHPQLVGVARAFATESWKGCDPDGWVDPLLTKRLMMFASELQMAGATEREVIEAVCAVLMHIQDTDMCADDAREMLRDLTAGAAGYVLCMRTINRSGGLSFEVLLTLAKVRTLIISRPAMAATIRQGVKQLMDDSSQEMLPLLALVLAGHAAEGLTGALPLDDRALLIEALE